MTEEQTKQWFSNELGYDIWNNKYKYKDECLVDSINRWSNNNNTIYQLIFDQKWLPAGRTLSNRGIVEGGSYSNCYSRGFIGDDLIDIMKAGTDLALTYKAEGGQGVSLSKIRPKGTSIRGLYQSDGIVPWMELYNTITKSISQGGSRKGALMISLNVWHKEAETFIKIKDDLGSITKANLSLEIDDEFINCVEDNITSIYEHRDYDSESIMYEVNPTELYNLIIKQAWKSAEPGVLFTNRFRNYNLMEFVDEYVIETCNPCGEQPLPKHGSCNLAAINLSEYVLNPFTDKARFDNDAFKNHIYHYIMAMDDIIEENMDRHPLPEQREVAHNYRNIGLGVMGYADMLIKLRMKYGSKEAITFSKTIFRTLFRGAVFASNKLAKERGTFPGYDGRIFDSEIIKNHFSQKEIDLLKIDGLRNASILSIAPTGSISTMLNVSGGIEPVFAFSHYRQTENINGGEIYKVYAGIAKEYFDLFPEETELPDYFVSSYDIDWRDRVNTQKVIQNSVDTAISSTVNLPRDIELEEIHDLYIEAWKARLKGITIYRDGSREGILTTEASSTQELQIKRPEAIPCDIHNVSIEGEQWTIIIGVLNKIPYEVFAFKNRNIHIKDVENAELVKEKDEDGKNHYSITSDNVDIINLSELYQTGEEEFITRLISRLVRLGEIKTVIKDAEKTYKHLNTFVSVIKRVLSKYTDSISIEELCPECGEPLIMSEGCKKCEACGYSKCN